MKYRIPSFDEFMHEDKSWQDFELGDTVHVKSINKTGFISHAYGRKFNITFVDGTTSTFDANDLEFVANESKGDIYTSQTLIRNIDNVRDKIEILQKRFDDVKINLIRRGSEYVLTAASQTTDDATWNKLRLAIADIQEISNHK